MDRIPDYWVGYYTEHSSDKCQSIKSDESYDDDLPHGDSDNDKFSADNHEFSSDDEQPKLFIDIDAVPDTQYDSDYTEDNGSLDDFIVDDDVESYVPSSDEEEEAEWTEEEEECVSHRKRISRTMIVKELRDLRKQVQIAMEKLNSIAK